MFGTMKCTASTSHRVCFGFGFVFSCPKFLASTVVVEEVGNV